MIFKTDKACDRLGQLLAASGFNAATGLFVSSSAGIVYERSWSLGHVAFKAETARNTDVNYVAATVNAVVHAPNSLLVKRSS